MDFNSLTHEEKEKLCIMFETMIQVVIFQGTSLKHVREMIDYTENEWPGFTQYRLERFKKDCPIGQVFGPYMLVVEEGESSENH